MRFLEIGTIEYICKIIGTKSTKRMFCKGHRQDMYLLFYWKAFIQYDNHLTSWIIKCRHHS